MKSKTVFPRCKLKTYFEITPMMKIAVEVFNNNTNVNNNFNSFILKFQLKLFPH